MELILNYIKYIIFKCFLKKKNMYMVLKILLKSTTLNLFKIILKLFDISVGALSIDI